MTARSLFAWRSRAALDGQPRLDRRRVAMLALLTSLGVVPLPTSTARSEGSVARLPAPPSVATTTASKAEPDTGETRPRPLTAHGETLNALAAVVARKYRVSEEATRELVAAAYREGGRNGLDPLLLLAVIAVESRFNPIAQSDGGALGLMQVIPRYHTDKVDVAKTTSVLDPHTNIELGARILKEYIGRAGTEVAGLQLYNGAAGDVSNAYANRVMGEKQWLQEAVRRSRDRVRA